MGLSAGSDLYVWQPEIHPIFITFGFLPIVVSKKLHNFSVELYAPEIGMENLLYVTPLPPLPAPPAPSRYTWVTFELEEVMLPFGNCTDMAEAQSLTELEWISFQHFLYTVWSPGAHWMGPAVGTGGAADAQVSGKLEQLIQLQSETSQSAPHVVQSQSLSPGQLAVWRETRSRGPAVK